MLIHPIVKQQAKDHGRDHSHDNLEPQNDFSHVYVIIGKLLQLLTGTLFTWIGKPAFLLNLLSVKRPQFIPVQHHNCHNSPQLNDHTKDFHKLISGTQLHKFFHKDQMTGTADGQPFRDTFHDSQKNYF